MFATMKGYQQLPQTEQVVGKRNSCKEEVLLDEKRRFFSSTLCRNICYCCLFMVVLLLLLSSTFRPGPSFYNKEHILGRISAAAECVIIIPVTVTRITYNNTLHHLELSLTKPCVVIVSEDTSYGQRSDPLVLEYVNRNSNWIYAKHAAPLFGIFAKFSHWLRSGLSQYLDQWQWVWLKEIVIQPIVNAYTIHFYDLFHFCFDELDLPWDSMVMVLEDDIMVRHDAVQFGRWVSKHLLANNQNYWALCLRNMQDYGQAIYRPGERVRDKDNYDVFVVHHRWSTWGYALTRTQWETWWHKSYPWWICWDSTLRKTMDYYDIPTVMSGLVRSRHISQMGTHSYLPGCDPWSEMDLHALPVTLNYTGFSPRIRDQHEPGVPSVDRINCDER